MPMKLFDSNAIGHEVICALYRQMNWQLLPRIYRDWNPNTLPEEIVEQFQQAPLFKDIELLTTIANGAYDRAKADETLLGEVLATIEQVYGDLRHPPFGPISNLRTWDFAQTPLGQVLNRAEVWLFAGDLITLSEAASLYTGRSADRAGLMVIERLIAKWEMGKIDETGEREGLEVWTDPSEPNHQKNKRVRKSAVLRLKEKKEQVL